MITSFKLYESFLEKKNDLKTDILSIFSEIDEDIIYHIKFKNKKDNLVVFYDDIKFLIQKTIETATKAEKNIPQVGVRLLKLCSEYDLNKISEQVQSYAEPLNARYIA